VRGKGFLGAALVAALLGTMATPAAAAPRGCDPLDPAHCLLPWPNDHFRKDGRLALRNAMMPRNKAGKPVRAADYNHSDGFSPGQIIVTRVPRLDLGRSRAVPVTNMRRSFARKAPIVVIDARTGRRQLIWAELDSQAPSDRARTLLVHPGANWHEGRRYIVALRNLKDARGRELEPRRAFRRFRNGAARGPRAHHFEDIFRRLENAGIRRESLYLAWDFTVASGDSLAGRLLFMRDQAFATLGDNDLENLRPDGSPPPFSISAVEDLGEVRRIDGSFTVPCFLNRPGCPPGARFRLDRRGLPVRSPGNVQEERFICLVPESGTNGRPLLFGHGLFGGAEAVLGLAPLVETANFVACATDWSGMSTEDVANGLALSENLSRFPMLADRTQQGFLNFLFLGRLMVHPLGFASKPEFAGKIDTRRLFYAGASQGGILGGALTAVAPDFERAALIVPAMNFSLLVTRAVPFAPFRDVLYKSYTGGVERALLASMLQILWDRSDANGYAWHMTRNPYPGTPRHTVLLHEAFGDHQVANVATEVEARVIGAHLRTPALDPGRSRDKRPFFGIRRIARLPWDGNALVVFDIGPERGDLGTPPAPVGNEPPTAGVDPHSRTGFESAAAAQFSEFLKIGGTFVDTCGGRPCYAAGWAGP
jgi:hypothetical protein